MNTPLKVALIDYKTATKYEKILELQKTLARELLKDSSIDGYLLLNEHLPVITFGLREKGENLLVDRNDLQKKGIDLAVVERGGLATFHGPGQLVGYPILKLDNFGLKIREHVWLLEEAIIKTLAEFKVSGERNPEIPIGIWTRGKKICSLGLQIQNKVSLHGFALNILTDLSNFSLINPCGITGNSIMTNLADHLSPEINFEKIKLSFRKNFEFLYHCELVTLKNLLTP